MCATRLPFGSGFERRRRSEKRSTDRSYRSTVKPPAFGDETAPIDAYLGPFSVIATKKGSQGCGAREYATGRGSVNIRRRGQDSVNIRAPEMKKAPWIRGFDDGMTENRTRTPLRAANFRTAMAFATERSASTATRLLVRTVP